MAGEWGLTYIREHLAQAEADIVGLQLTLPGGAVSWGGITGTLALQTDLQAALDGKSTTGHVHTIANITGLQGALDSKQALGTYLVPADMVAHEAAVNPHPGYLTQGEADALYSPVGGGSSLGGVATVTIPAAKLDWEQVVTTTGVTSAKRIILGLAPHLDTDENDPSFLDIRSMWATAGTDQITISLSFDTAAQGPIKFNWSAV